MAKIPGGFDAYIKVLTQEDGWSLQEATDRISALKVNGAVLTDEEKKPLLVLLAVADDQRKSLREERRRHHPVWAVVRTRWSC